MKVIAFDLDDCLCSRPKHNEHLKADKYKFCYPIKEMVDIVNRLYDDGYFIKIYTARGMSIFSGNTSKVYSNLFEVTTNHLHEWGVKYHELIMGKTHYDLLVDDKVLNSIGVNYEKIKKLL